MNCNRVGKRMRSALDGGRGKVAFSGQSLQPLCPDNSRSALAGGGKPALSVPPPDNSDSTRDWANLGEGPAGRIGELALASDVADFARFRAVCRPWRRCSPDPRAGGLDSRFLPRQWIMLDNALSGPRRHRFLNVSTGECIRMDLPELSEHTLLALTPEGLLLLFLEPTLVVRLLNPVTHQLTDLPPITALLRPEHHRSRSRGLNMEKIISVYSAGIVANASAVAVNFFNPDGLVVAKPGDQSWTVVDKGIINSALPFAERFYCANYSGVMVLTTSTSSDQQPPRLQLVAELSESIYFSQMMHSLHLVDNGGELLLVHRTRCHDSEYYRKYDVYKVDLEAGLLVPVKGFNGRAVFMGMFRSILYQLMLLAPLLLLIPSTLGPTVMARSRGTILRMEADAVSVGRYPRIVLWIVSATASGETSNDMLEPQVAVCCDSVSGLPLGVVLTMILVLVLVLCISNNVNAY